MGWTVPIAPVAYTPQIATDTTARTVTGTTFTQVTGDFSIAANDPNVGSVYILTAWGTFTSVTSPSGTPKLQPSIFGVTLPTMTLLPPNAVTYDVLFTVLLIVSATGATGSINGYEQWSISHGSALTNGTITIISPTTVNTTLASVFGVQGAWTAIGNSESMTINGTLYERDGPGAVAQ